MKAYAIGLALKAQALEPKAYELALPLVVLEAADYVVLPGGTMALELPSFAGSLQAVAVEVHPLQPSGALPFAIASFSGSVPARYAERVTLEPAGVFPAWPGAGLPLLGQIAAPYDTRVDRSAVVREMQRFEQAQSASSACRSHFQDSALNSQELRDQVQAADKLRAHTWASAQVAAVLSQAVQDTAQQAQSLHAQSSHQFEVAKSLTRRVADVAQQAQRLSHTASTVWQIAAWVKAAFDAVYEEAGIQRGMGLRVPPVRVVTKGWAVGLEFVPELIQPRTWAELQVGPFRSGAGLAKPLRDLLQGGRYQEAMRAGPAVAKGGWVPIEPEVPVDPTDPAARFIIPLLRVYMQLHTLSARLLPSGEAVVLNNVTISTDDDSFCWRLQASGPEHLMDQLAPVGGLPQRLEVVIDGLHFVFAVKSTPRTRSFGNHRVSVEGVSTTDLLAAPYMRPQTWHNAATQMTAQQIALQALEFTGVGLDWRINDWLLPAGAWSYQGTPLQVVMRVAESVNAVVRSHRNEDQLIVAPRYPLLPWQWAGATPNVQMPADVIVTDELRPEPRAAYNAIYVLGGPVGGVKGHIVRALTAGEEAAPAVQDDLITHADAAAMRGSWALAASGNKLMHTLSMPIRVGGDEPGILQPGQLLHVNDIGGPWRGLVRGVSAACQISEGSVRARQQVTVERVAAA